MRSRPQPVKLISQRQGTSSELEDREQRHRDGVDKEGMRERIKRMLKKHGLKGVNSQGYT